MSAATSLVTSHLNLVTQPVWVIVTKHVRVVLASFPGFTLVLRPSALGLSTRVKPVNEAWSEYEGKAWERG